MITLEKLFILFNPMGLCSQLLYLKYKIMGELSKLKGLGPKSEQNLNKIGIYTKKDLEHMGAVKALMKLKKEFGLKPNLNFLYAMVGAVENKHWLEIAQTQRERLIFELEGYEELENLFNEKNIDVKIQ